jgi:pantetheine-phosphate adenylyltransferase
MEAPGFSSGENEVPGVRVVYPGTFDPVTTGHIDIMKRAVSVFGGIHVSVAEATPKQTLFSAERRVELVKCSILEAGIGEGITVGSFQGLLVDHMREIGAVVFIRGLRALSDFEYEFQLQLMNRRLAPGITGVYMMPSESNIYLSSTLVKEIARHGGDVSSLVLPCVRRALEESASNG